jgi:hypothetical protein
MILETQMLRCFRAVVIVVLVIWRHLCNYAYLNCRYKMNFKNESKFTDVTNSNTH